MNGPQDAFVGTGHPHGKVRMMAETTCDVLVERLLEWDVDTVFGLPGDGINGFFESLRKARDRIRFIHVRHEEVAALAACGYAKFTGRLGVCVSTAGPGAVHLLNGLYDARVDQAPVLAITGMTYHDLIGTHYLQDIDTNVLFSDVARFNERVMGPAHMHNLADQACRTALSHRTVAHISIPIDWQVAAIDAAQRSKKNIKGPALLLQRHHVQHGRGAAIRHRRPGGLSGPAGGGAGRRWWPQYADG
jgi:pyruvate dehydrogenase (quinone)